MAYEACLTDTRLSQAAPTSHAMPEEQVRCTVCDLTGRKAELAVPTYHHT